LRRLRGSEAVVRGVGVDRVWQDGVQIPPNEILEKDIKWPSGETIAGRIVTSDGVPIPERASRRSPSPGRRGMTAAATVSA